MELEAERGGVMEDKDSYCVWEYADKDVPFYLWVYVTECGAELTLLENAENLAGAGFTFCPACSRRIKIREPKEGEKWEKG